MEKAKHGFTIRLMNRLVVALIFACASTLCAANPTANEEDGVVTLTASAARPNLIVIMADDMGFSDLGCYGSAIDTPHLDKLAAEGLRFRQFYNTGRCCPSRASLLTGLYSHQAGIGHMLGKTELPAYSDQLREDVGTLPEALRAAGYATFMSGKWHIGWSDEGAPNQRGFDRFYGSRGFVDSYFGVVKHTDIYLDNTIVNPAGKPAKNHLHPDRLFYTTDTYTDYAMKFVADHVKSNSAQEKDQPFFLYLAHNAPHFPLHTKPEDLKKYRGRFKDGGWDAFRKKRYEKMLELAIITKETKLSLRDSPDWDSLDEAVKDELDLKFALYCGLIDCLDQNIGRLVEFLREQGELDNSVIFFLSDNGSTKETGMFGIGGHKVNPGNYDEWARKGGWSSSLGQGWANVANAPFRRYKRENHEGGIASPLIVWTGKEVAQQVKPGTFNDSLSHIIDLFPTCLELAGAEKPAGRNGKKLPSLEGLSLVPALAGEKLGDRTLFWEHEGNRALLHGSLKLVAQRGQPWELYASDQDRSETSDLVASTPEAEVKELISKWQSWADRCGVKPWPEVQASRKAYQQKLKR
ncbi:MAG: arylsulfatase [Verrucomicrobiota bacterium]